MLNRVTLTKPAVDFLAASNLSGARGTIERAIGHALTADPKKTAVRFHTKQKPARGVVAKLTKTGDHAYSVDLAWAE